MIAYSKIGFHAGPGCACTGISDFWSTLHAAGRPIFHKSVDDYGTIYELITTYGDYATAVFRLSSAGQGGSFDFDVPAYHLDPKSAAQLHWSMTLDRLPIEFDRRVWLELINEVDKNRADWLGRFAVEVATLANMSGYKVALYAWSSGEPEPEHWTTPGQLAYLQYCATNPTAAAIALHEYSYTIDSLFEGCPYKVGRFKFLHEACNANGLPYPTILITEFGWCLDNIPDLYDALQQLKDAAAMYASHVNIKGAAIWYLGSGANWKGINQKVQALIGPLGEFAKTAFFEVDEPEIPLMDTTYKPAAIPRVDVLLPAAAQGARFRLAFEDKDGVVIKRVNVNTPAKAVKVRCIALEAITDITVPPPDPAPEPAQSPGIDVSHWQGAIDWTKAAIKAKFAIMKLTEGVNFVDPKFYTNWQAAKSAGLIRGAYHYFRNGYNAIDQANHFVSKLPKDDKGELPLVADIEDTTSTASANEIRSFLLHVETLTGRRPIIYTGAWYWNPRFGIAGWEKEYHLWVANYAATSPTLPTAWDDWLIWQYTSSGKAADYGASSAFIDENLFNGRVSDFVATLPAWNAPKPPELPLIDLLPYMQGDGRIFELRFKDGSQERNQTQTDAVSNAFYIVKGENQGYYERWVHDSAYIYLDMDTSPAPADDGTKRYYQVKKDGQLSPWIKRHMSEGETYRDGGHHVQFYRKDNCQPHPQNSGAAENVTTLVDRYDRFVLDNGMVIDDVIEISAGQESHFFAIGYGRIGWESPWGEAWISEEHAPGARPPLVREKISCL